MNMTPYITDLPDDLLKVIFKLVDEEDRRQLSRTCHRLHRHYRQNPDFYKFFYHIQGNSVKLLNKGLRELMHRRKIDDKFKFPLMELPHLRISNFDLTPLEYDYRSFRSIINEVENKSQKNQKDTPTSSTNPQQKIDEPTGLIKIKPKPRAVKYISELELYQVVISSGSLHVLATLFTNVTTLRITRSSVFLNNNPPSSPFLGHPKFNLKMLELSYPVATNKPGAFKLIHDYIDNVQHLTAKNQKLSQKRCLVKRLKDIIIRRDYGGKEKLTKQKITRRWLTPHIIFESKQELAPFFSKSDSLQIISS